MTDILKKLDYDELAEKILLLETASVSENQIRIQYSYCFIYTDTEINLKKIGSMIEQRAANYIKTNKDYISDKKRYLAVSSNLLTRVYCEESYINSTIYSENQYNSQFRSISKDSEYVPPVPFSIVIADIKSYFMKNGKSGKNVFLIDTNNIVDGDKLENLAPYADIINTERWIYNTKYHFEFQVDQELIKGKYHRNYSVPLKLYNDIYFLDKEDKDTNCSLCKSLLFGKYYSVKEKAVCKFCVHFSQSKIINDDEIIFVEDNSLSASDIGFSEIMNLTNFVKKDGYYTNDDYILFPKEAIEYIFNKQNINPVINEKSKKIILVTIIAY